MAEVFGAVAAGIALSAQLIQLSRFLHKTIKEIKYARPEIVKLEAELDIFSGLYDQFMTACVLEPKDKYCDATPIQRLVAWAEETRDGIEKLLDRVGGLDADSMMEKLTARLLWFFSEHEVKCLRLSLCVARESMNGFTNVRIIEKLNEQMAMLRAAREQGNHQTVEEQFGRSVKAQIRMLKSMRNNHREQSHAIHSRLQEAKSALVEHSRQKSYTSDIVPEPERLLRFTSYVETYVENTLLSAKSERRRRRRESTYTSTTKSHSRRTNFAQPPTPPSSNSFLSTPLSSDLSGSPAAPASSASTTNDYADILNYCKICLGTCLRAEQHGAAITFTGPAHTSRSVDDVATYLDQQSFVPKSERTSRTQIVRESSPSQASSRGQLPNESRSNAGGNVTMEGQDVGCTCKKAVDTSDAGGGEEVELEEGGAPDERLALDEEMSSGSEVEEEDEIDDATESSPFHPVAGVKGSFPRGWRTRHERSESPQDFW